MASGNTVAEFIYKRIDAKKEHMGLTTWADAPDGKIKKTDVTVAKNYLSEEEMKQLSRSIASARGLSRPFRCWQVE